MNIKTIIKNNSVSEERLSVAVLIIRQLKKDYEELKNEKEELFFKLDEIKFLLKNEGYEQCCCDKWMKKEYCENCYRCGDYICYNCDQDALICLVCEQRFCLKCNIYPISNGDYTCYRCTENKVKNSENICGFMFYRGINRE